MNRVIAFSRVHNKVLTVNDCKLILKDIFNQIKVVTVDKIQNVVSNFFNIALSEMLSQRDISLSLVRLGADEWNKELAPRIREYTGSNIIFFDEQMIGIHSKLLKKNARSISRRLKREKVKFKGRDIMDIMSTSVFYYIENKFVGND